MRPQAAVHLVLAAWLCAMAPPASAALRSGPCERGVNEAGCERSLPVPMLAAESLVAGQRVELHWPTLGVAHQELEIVLSADDGRHYDIRLSPELDAGTTHYLWIVPNLGVTAARIRLRARIGGREVSGPAGHRFSIVANPVHPSERWSFHAGEWWEDPAGEPFMMPGLVTPERGPSLRTEHQQRVSPGPARAPVMPLPALSRAARLSQLHETAHPKAPSGVAISRCLPQRE